MDDPTLPALSRECECEYESREEKRRRQIREISVCPVLEPPVYCCDSTLEGAFD
jgi:hypothetical protein